MLELAKISPEMKKKFILLFTRELIKNSETETTKILIQDLKKHPEKQIITTHTPKEIAKEIIKGRKEHPRMRPIFRKLSKPFNNIKRAMPPMLRIPETRLPTHLQTIKPIPRTYPISLGKLDQLLKNPNIRVIECNGPDQNIIIRAPQSKQTEIKLTKQEIDSILQGFSKTSGIPLNQGINKIIIGNLTLSAIISEVIGSKFIIKKNTTPFSPKFR